MRRTLLGPPVEVPTTTTPEAAEILAAVNGWMTRAVASGGACVLGAEAPRRLAVNRGGVLERWARERFADRELRAVARYRSAGVGVVSGSRTWASRTTGVDQFPARSRHWTCSERGPSLSEPPVAGSPRTS